jgi:DNA replication factor GINS
VDQQFYQELRKIQKKERNNGTLARVDEDFYTKIHEYLDELKQEAMGDPFSSVHNILKEAQIIATEICERREHKITDAAVVNIHRSYHLFIGKPQFDLVDSTPLNLTPEEEKFYFSLIDTLKNHRGNISLEKMSDDDSDVKSKPEPVQTNTLTSPKAEPKEDEVLQRLDDIKKAKPIVDEKREPVEKQIVKSQQKAVRTQSIEENPNAFDGSDEFYDLDSQKSSKDANLVTMLVFEDVGPIVGVDEKVYGPFRPQDLVTMPNVNAKIFVKNRKGRIVKI